MRKKITLMPKFVNAALAVALCVSLCSCGGALPVKTGAPSVTISPPAGRLSLECGEDGRVTINDSLTGAVWSSIPAAEDVSGEGGLARILLQCNLIAYTVEPGDNDSIIMQNQWLSATTADLEVEEIPDGFRLVYEFRKAGLIIPLELRLLGDRLVVSVRRGEIEENGDERLYWLSIFPNFGAGGPEDEGYLIIPDGSGALINFNNNKKGYGTYHEPVYGFDEVYTGHSQQQYKKGVNMPVFGIEKNGVAMLGVISKGEGSAYLDAYTGGQTSRFNTVYPTFYFIASDMLTIGSSVSGERRNITKFAFKQDITDECEIQYLFPERDGYSGMAGRYREYLLETGQAVLRGAPDTPPFYLGLFGGFRKEESMFGFLVRRYKAMTTFAQAGEIIDSLMSLGVSDIAVIYDNWTGQQADTVLQNSASAAGQLGGESGRSSLDEKIAGIGGEIYYSYDPAYIHKTSLSFLPYLNSARKIGGSPVILYQYSKAHGVSYDNEPPGYVPDYKTLYGAFSRFAAGAEGNLPGVYYPSLTNMLYSSFSPGNFIPRETALAMMRTIIGEGGYDKAGRASNAYAFSEMSQIFAAPASASRHSLFDYDVPFYQLVVNGLSGYSTPCVNTDGDARFMTLKAIETGAGIYFHWVYADPSILMETPYDTIYGSDYRLWIDDAVLAYKEIGKAFEEIGTTRLISHERLSEGVYLSVFGNGLGVVVNYTGEAYTHGGVEASPMGWAVTPGPKGGA